MLSATGFRLAATQEFAFLSEYGFTLAPPTTASLYVAEVTYLRPDAVLVVRYSSEESFYIRLMPPDDDDRSLPAGERARRSMERSTAISTFGSYSLKTDDAGQAANIIGFYAQRFVSSIASLLKQWQSPPDFPGMVEITRAALKQLSVETGMARTRRHAERAWSAQRWHRVVRDYESLKKRTDLTDEEQYRLEQARLLLPVRPPLLVRGDESEQEWWRRCAAVIEEQRKAVHETALRRGDGLEQLFAWEDAAEALHEALRIMYSDAFWQEVAQVQAGDPAHLETVIAFLEADPWCFRSGRTKERLTRILPRHQFTEEQGQRLRRVVLHTVDAGDRQEFRSYCKLARRLDEPGLRSDLLLRLRSDNPGVARRALWMLSYLPDLHLAPDDLKRARTIILREGKDRRTWQVFLHSHRPGWVKKLGRKYWSEDWQAELIDLANDLANDPEQGRAARMLLQFMGGVRRPEHGDDAGRAP